jgi:hypothetical protein
VISSAADFKEYLRCRYVDEYYELEEIDASTTGSSRRKSVRKISGITRRSTDISQESTLLERITQYKYPRLAKYVNFTLVHIVGVKKRPQRHRSSATLSSIPQEQSPLFDYYLNMPTPNVSTDGITITEPSRAYMPSQK